MSHDVFISYSSKNTQIVNALVHHLEENKIRCWIAPRDIVGGAEYADVITDAIKNSRILVLVYSEHSAISRFCKQETNLALSNGKIIIPFRIDSSELSGSMEFYLNDKHWIDAFPNPELHFGKIVMSIQRSLSGVTDQDDCKVQGSQQSQNKFLRFLSVIVSTMTGLFGLAGCGFVIAAVAHIGKIHEQWKPWMFWVYPFLMPAIFILGLWLAQRHPIAFAKKWLYRKKEYKRRSPLSCRGIFMHLLRILTAWIVVIIGLVLVVGIPISGCVQLNGGFVISRDDFVKILYIGSSVLCWGYLLLKTGWALLDEDWVKFQFSPRRLGRCILIMAIPFLVALLCMLIFPGVRV